MAGWAGDAKGRLNIVVVVIGIPDLFISLIYFR